MRIDEIARKAHVSRSTVSRVLNGNPNVRSNTREAVERVIREMNYVPNAAARSLASRRAGVVGVVLQNVMQPYWAGMFAGIESELVQRGYGVLLANCRTRISPHDFLGNRMRVLRNLLIQNVDGVVIALDGDLERDEIDMLESSGKPFVVIQNTVPDDRIVSVNVDNVLNGQTITDYLCRCGHRVIWHAAGPLGSSIAKQRLEGFLSSARTHHLVIDDSSIVNCGSLFDDGYWCMRRILGQSRLPTALFFQNDISAYGAMLAAREQHVDIPGDISIAGIDRLSAMMDISGLLPDLTSMEMPVVRLGATAIQMIVQMIESGERPESVVLPCELHIGATVRVLSEQA